jgi:diacylglycerol kinase (ATP)
MRNKFFGTGEPGYHPITKIKVCLEGIYHATRFDFSFAYKLFLSIGVLIICFILRQWIDFFFIEKTKGHIENVVAANSN